ncbi:ABC transporter permease, partial [Halomonas litopenaei]|nr:ABC transporter permease [Halomonas litopenaei]
MTTLSKQDIGKILARQGILIAFAFFIIGFTLANGRFLSP